MTPAPHDRTAFLERVRSPSPTTPKAELIERLCRGRSVLDIGCIDHSADAALALGDDWLHHRLQGVATELVGLDVLEDDARRLNDLGYAIVVGDAERFDLGRCFDIIVCGDVIEHMSNIGMFLGRVRAHMHRDSRAVVTTPNPFNIEQSVRAVLRNEIFVNDEHTVWLDPQVMFETVTRSGFVVTEFHWIDTRFAFPIRGGRIVPRLANAFSAAVMRRRPACRRDYAVVLAPAPADG